MLDKCQTARRAALILDARLTELDRPYNRFKVIVITLLFVFLTGLHLLAGPSLAQTAGTITFTAQTTTGDGSVVPVLTWSTSPAATSCTASGDWSGTKAAAGTETLAAITVSRTYNLSCTWPGDTSATLRWTAPTTNVDGSALTDLAGFRIYYGTSASNLNQQITVANATATQRIVSALTPATWFFAMTAYNARDVESARTGTVSKVISTATASRSVGITVNPRPGPPTGLTAT